MEIEDEIEIEAETITVASDSVYLQREESVKIGNENKRKYYQASPLSNIPHKINDVHESVVRKPKRYNCRICKRPFRNPYEVEVHMYSHSSVRNFHCELCPKSFKYKRSLRMHIKKLHPPKDNTPKTFTCPRCSKSFYSYRDLLIHIKIHSEVSKSPFMCKYCGKTFTHPFTLARHVKKDHGEVCLEGELKNQQGNSGIKEEDDDDVLFVKEYKYEDEEEEVSKQIQQEEEEGDSNIPVEVEILEALSESSDEEVNPDAEKCLSRFCGNHAGVHFAQVKSICSANFIGKQIFPTRNGEKYICPMCSKVCPSKHKLETHVRCHTHEKPFQCSVCLKKFSDKGNLNKHMVVHSSARPYTCEICQISFKRKPMLNKHVFQKHGMLGNDCPYCTETVFGSLNMKSHIKSQHRGLPVDTKLLSESPIACSVCERKFDSFDKLREHAKKYLPLQYLCKICGKIFPEEYRMTKHFARTHMNDESFSNMTIDDYSTVIEMDLE